LAWKDRLCQRNVFVTAPDGHHLAFLDIASESRSAMEGIKDYLSCLQVFGDRGNEKDDVVCVQRRPQRDRTHANWVEERPIVDLTDHGMQHLHDKEEEQGR
jgi:hypothetical protein